MSFLMNQLNHPERVYHSSVVIGDDVFVWGGYQKDLPMVHESPEKKRFTRTIESFNLITAKWEKRATTGSPPDVTMYYSCCNIGDEIYYFGGCCKPANCYHDNLFVLNTTTNKWREVICSDDNRPISKAFCGMISFSSGGEDYLLVIGGCGPLPANAPVQFQYTPNPNNPSICWTNEVHLMCVSSSPGKWRVPVRTGDLFPQYSSFSTSTLPGNKTILFGGGASDKRGEGKMTNDVFIISFTDNCMDCQRIVKPLDPAVQWPKERTDHSSVVVSSVSSDGVRRPHLVVLGGRDGKGDIIPDCWIMDIEWKNWKKISVPESVTKRWGHSISSFTVSVNCVWLLITGGGTTESVLVTSPNNVMIVELVFSPSDNQWSVSNVMNSKDMKKKDQYSKLLFDRLSEGRRQCQMNGERVVPEESSITGGEEQIMKLKQRLEEEREETNRQIQDLKQQHRVELQQKENELQQRLLQHQGELNTIKERLEQEQQEREEVIQQKQVEVQSLRDRLESCPWVLERGEVVLTDEKIGGGAYGEVRVAIFRGTRVAAKCLYELIVSDYNKGLFTREMEISSRIHHPNIVQFVGATRVNNPILLYELMATSLHNKLQEGQPLTRPQIVEVCLDIASALCYLHLWKPDPIIHRDVSSPNVLMEPLANGRWRSKLSDFGSANLQLRVKTAIPGNPAYASPEADNPRHHSPAMDIYSFGVLTTEMILHCPPEIDTAKHEQQARSIDWRPMKVLVLGCIKNDRVERPTSLQVLEDLKLRIK